MNKTQTPTVEQVNAAARKAREIAAAKGFDSPEAYEARMEWNRLRELAWR